MADLTSESRHIALLVQPYAVEEVGPPTLLRANLVVSAGDTTLLRGVVSLTSEDVLQMVEHITALSTQQQTEMENIDGDLRINLTSLIRQGDVAVAVWMGEPYDVMHGVRFVTTESKLREFGQTLLQETNALKAAS